MKTIKLLKHLSAVLLLTLLIPQTVAADDFTYNGLKYSTNSDGISVTLTGYDSYPTSGALSIPQQVPYNGTTYSVTSIGYGAFYGCSGLTSVTIPNSVTTIGDYAFYQCSGLTGALTIPNSVTSIGNGTFSGCSGLTSVTIGNSVTSIGDWAFYECSGLTSVTIGNSVTIIGYMAFAGCSGLTSVHITDLAAWCKISFGDYYAHPLGYAHHLFLNGEEVKDLVIPNSVTYIGNYAFFGCSGLTSVTIPNSVTSIGKSAFYDCYALTSVTIGNSVTEIGILAFYECSGLTSVTIPNSVTAIGQYAFEGCSGLTSVDIPNSVTSIGSGAFDGCSGLTSVNITDLAAWCKISFGNGYANPIYKAHHLYLNGEEVKDLTIPNSVTTIGRWAFDGCSGLTSVTIPNSVTSIGMSAFLDCSGLTSVDIPNSVTSIGNYTFTGCSGLKSIVVQSRNPKYDSRNNCNAIIETATHTLIIGCKNTIIPNSVETIGVGAFEGCSGLTSVTIPNSVTSIGYEAFYDCYALTSVTIPNSVTSIGECAFAYCSGLKDIFSHIVHPENVALGEDVFYYVHECTLHVPKGSIPIYRECDQWKDFLNIVEMSATPGDLNGDGIVDVSDVNIMIDMVLGKQVPDMEFADLNGDGIIDVSDVNKLIDIVLGKD